MQIGLKNFIEKEEEKLGRRLKKGERFEINKDCLPDSLLHYFLTHKYKNYYIYNDCYFSDILHIERKWKKAEEWSYQN